MPHPRLSTYRDAIRSATGKLGGDPDTPVFSAPALNDLSVDLRDLIRVERSICAYALEIDRRASGSLHAEYAEEVAHLLAAFEISELSTEIERLITPTGLSEP